VEWLEGARGKKIKKCSGNTGGNWANTHQLPPQKGGRTFDVSGVQAAEGDGGKKSEERVKKKGCVGTARSITTGITEWAFGKPETSSPKYTEKITRGCNFPRAEGSYKGGLGGGRGVVEPKSLVLVKEMQGRHHRDRPEQ